MTIAKHPKDYKPCPECGAESFTHKRKVKQIGATYKCDECGVELYAYDSSSHGMGQDFNWNKAQLVIEALGHERKCLDCNYEWHYGGTADRPTCPECKGKRTQRVDE
jgi:predicted RNA-binding Zn-ribbon protein involved in translation (DUF1610 family)